MRLKQRVTGATQSKVVSLVAGRFRRRNHDQPVMFPAVGFRLRINDFAQTRSAVDVWLRSGCSPECYLNEVFRASSYRNAACVCSQQVRLGRRLQLRHLHLEQSVRNAGVWITTEWASIHAAAR